MNTTKYFDSYNLPIMRSGSKSMIQQFTAVLKLLCISENENNRNDEEGEMTNKSREETDKETDKITQSSSSQLPLFINPLERSYFIRK